MIRIQPFSDTSYQPGLIGQVISMLASRHPHQRAAGVEFEAELAADLGAFLRRFDSEFEALWIAM